MSVDTSCQIPRHVVRCVLRTVRYSSSQIGSAVSERAKAPQTTATTKSHGMACRSARVRTVSPYSRDRECHADDDDAFEGTHAAQARLGDDGRSRDRLP